MALNQNKFNRIGVTQSFCSHGSRDYSRQMKILVKAESFSQESVSTPDFLPCETGREIHVKHNNANLKFSLELVTCGR